GRGKGPRGAFCPPPGPGPPATRGGGGGKRGFPSGKGGGVRRRGLWGGEGARGGRKKGRWSNKKRKGKRGRRGWEGGGCCWPRRPSFHFSHRTTAIRATRLRSWSRTFAAPRACSLTSTTPDPRGTDRPLAASPARTTALWASTMSMARWWVTEKSKRKPPKL